MRINYFVDGTKAYQFEDDLEEAVHFFSSLFWSIDATEARKRHYLAGDYELAEYQQAIQLFTGGRN